MPSKPALGKGLNALFKREEEKSPPPKASPAAESTPEGEFILLPVSQLIANRNQPRKRFSQEALEELAASIKAQGVLQPILAEALDEPGEKTEKAVYRIIAGERRFKAAQLAGLTEVPVILKALAPAARLEVALIENIQREDLNPIEEALAYKSLMESGFLSQEELAQRVGKNRSSVANALRLLRLEPDMQEALMSGELTPGHARAILSLENPADGRVLFERIRSEGLSVREAEKQAADLSRGGRAAGQPEKAGKTPPALPADLRQIEQKFIDAFGTKVKIRGTHDSGKIEISYLSMDDLERIIEILP
ncbi:MAG: ParB/RepB/Spo0J family partition protein [Spirochaetales bacterium]|nr:ParB/RepB/Spo0J family partition protein [Spirochaetales bacterium]